MKCWSCWRAALNAACEMPPPLRVDGDFFVDRYRGPLYRTEQKWLS